MSTPDGLILAGGSSSRFGSNKSTFELDGQRMIDRVSSNLRPLIKTLFISQSSQEEVLITGSRSVFDKQPGKGPLSGILACFKASSQDWILVCPVDMPFVSSALLEQILQARDHTVQAVVASDPSGGRYPLCGVFHRSLEPTIESSIEEEKLKVSRWLEDQEYRLVVGPKEELLNLNERP